MIDGLFAFDACDGVPLMFISSNADCITVSRCGQYRIVCAKSPYAPQILHLYSRKRGHTTRFRLSFTLCDVYTCSFSPLFLQNTQNYKPKKKMKESKHQSE